MNEQVSLQRYKCAKSGNQIPPKENNHAAIETVKK